MDFTKFGKYTIIKKLASGGMADILLAGDLSPTGFGRFVVIKRALSQFSNNSEFKDMFKNEGKVACNLKHRNITPIYEFGELGNQFFLAMEYISGKNLREFFKRIHSTGVSASIPNIIHIIKEVASGLSYAHNAIDSNTGKPLKLIHRDVSPQNIMLSFDGEVKIIDFGIAKIADVNLTRAGHLKGKFSYMSPEQASGEVLDERTDIFCLGIILWELLTAERLFATKNEMSALKAIKLCSITPPKKINPEVSSNLNNIVMKALHKNRNLRYETAGEMERALTVFLNKNYPEYSHYDFISLIKKIYGKEIGREREQIKSYSEKLKKYVNEANIKENLEIQETNLNIPSLSDVVEKGTQTLPISEGGSQTEDDITEDLYNKKGELTKEDDIPTVSIYKTDAKKRNLKSSRPLAHKKDKKERQINTGVQSVSDLYQNAQSKSFSSTLYSKESLLEENQKDTTKGFSLKGKLLAFAFVSLLLIGTAAGAFLFLKKKEAFNIFGQTSKILDSLGLKSQKQKMKGASSSPASSKATHSHSRSSKTKGGRRGTAMPPAGGKTSRSSSARKPQPHAQKRHPSQATTVGIKAVFINSSPSGAAIFLNDSFSSRWTPSVLKLSDKGNFTITLKKQGYVPKSIQFRGQSNLDVRLQAVSGKKTYPKRIQIIE